MVTEAVSYLDDSVSQHFFTSLLFFSIPFPQCSLSLTGDNTDVLFRAKHSTVTGSHHLCLLSVSTLTAAGYTKTCFSKTKSSTGL